MPVQIAVPISQEVTLYGDSRRIAIIKKNNELAVIRERKGLSVEIQGRSFSGEVFSLTPSAGQTVKFENRSYRGKIQFVPDGNDVLVINTLDIEDYLKGVLPAELGKINEDSVSEAVKAFAITARTFAINRILEYKKNYDVETTVSSQVFFSVESEKPAMNALLAKTKGKILLYDGKPATIFFHSCCGGSTEDAANVFNNTSFPYLTAKQDGDPAYCRYAPIFSWSENYSAQKFLQMLHTYEKRISLDQVISSVAITKKFESGRVANLQIIFSDNTELNIPAKQIRLAIKRKNYSGILRSSLFTIDLKYNGSTLDSIILKGSGNGHGVGLCQWGAFQMAKDGKDFDDILDFYFPGTKIRKIDDLN